MDSEKANTKYLYLTISQVLDLKQALKILERGYMMWQIYY